MDGFVQNLADAVSVFGEPVGEISCREFFKSPEFHGLELAEQVTAQLLAHLQGRTCQQGVLPELGELLDSEDHNALTDEGKNATKIPGSQRRK